LNKLDFWNDRAKLGEMAGTKDLIAKELEMKAIASYVKNGMRILDFGCGNGITALYLKEHFSDIEIVGIDFSEEMIKRAEELLQDQGQKKYHFMVGDVFYLEYLKNTGMRFDLVYTERTLVNLNNWEMQKDAIEVLTDLLNPNGRYIMCENSWDGLQEINRFRKKIKLSEIKEPWHNLYIKDRDILCNSPSNAVLEKINYYSSTYYFLSRIMNAWMYHEPDYNSDINQLALKLPSLDCKFSQGRIWEWVKI
jgi:ubiquinone/menaquinone biosynthesis C-methylase UbiE